MKLENKIDGLTALFIATTVMLGAVAVGQYQKNQALEEKVSQVNTSSYEDPIVWSSTPSWYQTQTGDYQFSLSIYNGGDAQAENVEMGCGVFDSNFETVATFRQGIGSVAGGSVSSETFLHSFETVPPLNSTAACVVLSCSNSCVLPMEKALMGESGGYRG